MCACVRVWREMDISVRRLCEIFSGFNVPKCHWKSVNFWHSNSKNKKVGVFLEHSVDDKYLSCLVIPCHPSHILRSSSSANLLQVCHTNLIFGSRFFHAAAPTIQNSVSDLVHLSDTFTSFWRHLRIHFFSQQLLAENSNTFDMWLMTALWVFLLPYLKVADSKAVTS